MASVTRGTLKDALSQVVSYDGGNQIGKNQDVLVDSVRDIEVIDGSGGNVTLTADQSGGVVFAGGGARTITLPAVAAGLNFKIVSTTAHAHIISGSAGELTVFNYTGVDNTNGTTLARTSANSKCAMTLANVVIGEQLEGICDGSEWYFKGDLNDTPTFT